MKRHNKNSIWNRLKYSFILILIVPVLALGSYMVYSSIAFVKNERNMEAKQMMETNILDLNNRLEQCENSLIYAASNFTLQEFLQMNPEEYIQVNKASKNVGPLLYNVLLSNQYYKKLSVYAEKDFHVMSALIRNSSEVENETWYQETLKTSDICWWYEEEKFFQQGEKTMLHPGLYEQVINNALTGELAEIPEARKSVAPIDKAEASKVLAQYLADVVQKGLDNVWTMVEISLPRSN